MNKDEFNKRFGMRMGLHLNGGNKFSELHYIITKDGEDTQIKRIKVTDGSPRYMMTDDYLMHGETVLHMKDATDEDVVSWIVERA